MKEILESFNFVCQATGGAALLVLIPLLPAVLLFGGLVAAGRGCWSRGTESRRIAEARKTLAKPRYSGDEFYRSIAEDYLKTR